MFSRPIPARLTVLSLACAAAWPVLAQSTLPETVVTATRVEQPLTDVVADVSIIDRAHIERSGAAALADVLARVPGIVLSRNGGPAASTSVYLRGGETRFTAVFIDGVRVDSQATGGATWNAIPLSRVDRIEVLRGPAAAIYGSDALAGVIQIFTREGEPGVQPTVGLGLGSHGTRRLDLGVAGAQDRLDYALGLTRETAAGFNAQPSANPDRDGHRQTSASARLGFKPVAGHKLEATWLRQSLKAQYDGWAPGNDDLGQHRLQTLGLNWTARWTEAYRSTFSVGRADDRYETQPSPYLADTTVTSYLWQNEWRHGDHLITGALERREDRLNNASTAPTVTRRAQNALALGHGWRHGAHTLQINARHDNDSEFGAQNTGSIAYALGLAPHWRATASAGTAFRAPTLFQRFSLYGTPTLRPETGRNVEVGLRYERQGTRASATLYRNRFKDLITYVAGPGACANGVGMFPGCFGNTSRAQVRGLTLAGSGTFGGVVLGASLDLLDPEDLGSGRTLARRAKRTASLSADTQWAGWALGGEWQLVGARYDNAANTQRLGGYGLLNLSASKAIGPEWRLLLRVDNLTDKGYETARGYATAGRTLYAGLSWSPR